MSFSFNFNAKTVEEAKAEVRKQFETNVLPFQPDHAKDQELVYATADGYLAALGDAPDGQVMHVNVAGSVGWYLEGETKHYTSYSVSVSAWFTSAG